MPRRIASLLLSLAILLAAGAAAPCAGNAACPMMAAARRMDCCAAKTGISKPGCCESRQVRHSPAPVTPDRPAQSSLTAPAAQLATAAVSAVAGTDRSRAVRRIVPGTAPPGVTLLAQHTSLLL